MVILYFIVGFVGIALFIGWVMAMIDVYEDKQAKEYRHKKELKHSEQIRKRKLYWQQIHSLLSK